MLTSWRGVFWDLRAMLTASGGSHSTLVVMRTLLPASLKTPGRQLHSRRSAHHCLRLVISLENRQMATRGAAAPSMLAHLTRLCHRRLLTSCSFAAALVAS